MRVVLLSLCLLFPFIASANELQLASAAPTPKFISLQSVREGRPLVHVRAADSNAPLLRPVEGVAAGFKPLNRAKLNALAPSRAPAIALTASVPPRAESISPMRVVNEVEKRVSTSETLRAPKASNASRLSHAWPLPLKTSQDFTSAFGMRRDPFTGDPRFHEGIDISAKQGTPVLASADGVVDKVTTGRDYGKYVVVTHRDDSQTIYGHLSKQSVQEGARVTQGQKIGEVGSTGRSTGPHLHFQVERGGKAVNPLAQVRLPSEVNRAVAMK